MLYEYECEQGHIFERYLPLSEYKAPQTCECGSVSSKIFTHSAMVRGDLEPFIANSGKQIHSRRQWTEHLKETNCIEMGHSDIESQKKISEKRLANVEKDPTRKERIIYEMDKRGIH